MKYILPTNTAATAIPPIHVPSILEANGIDARDVSPQYCGAIDAYLRHEISEQHMFRIMGSKKLLPNGGL
jgi:hypothetical protein